MDVTSLLNVAAGTNPIIRRDSLESTPAPSEGSTVPSTAIGTPEKTPSSRRTSDVRTPRNRTPWDAGGYSLPLSLDTKFSVVSIHSAYCSESPVDHSTSTSCYDIPSSDSCHSRSVSLGSSVIDMANSTINTPMTSSHPGRPAFVGEPEQPLNITIGQRSSLVSDTESQLTARPNFPREDEVQAASGVPKSPKHKFSDSHSSLSSYTSSSQSGGHSRISSMSTVSGIGPFSSLLNDMPSLETKLAESQQSNSAPAIGDVQPPSPRSRRVHSLATSPSGAFARISKDGRPQSPSDAILITRGMGSNRSSPTNELSPRNAGKHDLNLLGLPQDSNHSRTHKRAVSAPDFPAISAPSFHPFPSVSESPAFQPQYAMTSPTETPPTGIAHADIKCMYIDNCDTGSQPRKAISHIFGRNKLCTRMIPAPVWVHFCRKHYQRSRYRNAHEYAKLQVDLVLKQIDRVQQWSDENERAEKSGVVKDWSLSVRKREQKRIEDRKETGKKRPYQDESEEEQDLDGAVLNGTAVPKWLLEKCGSGYPTATVQAVVTQLKAEIDSGRLAQIPDIEILPNITSNDAEDGKPKTYLKRKTTGGAHKRSQSMGVALRPEALPMVRRVSQPNNYWGGEGFIASPVEKRQRIADLGDSYFADRHVLPGLPRNPERMMPTMRRMHQLPHRPAFANIREHQPEVDYYSPPQPQMDRYVFTAGGPHGGPHGGSHGGPLPAPTPQRRPSQPIVPHLESSSSMGNYNDPRRPFHQRSQSEMGALQNGAAPLYRPSSSSGFQPVSYGYAPGPPEHESYEPAYAPRHENPFVQGATGYYEDAPPSRQYSYGGGPFQAGPPPSHLNSMGGSRHARHQSTPNAARSMHRNTTSHAFSPLPMAPRHQETYERSPSDHARRSSYAALPMPSMPPRVMEDESAKTTYGARR